MILLMMIKMMMMMMMMMTMIGDDDKMICTVYIVYIMQTGATGAVEVGDNMY